MATDIYEWESVSKITQVSYICGYCGNKIGPHQGYYASNEGHLTGHEKSYKRKLHIYICPTCHRPTFFDSDEKQYPGVVFGNVVADVSDTSVASLYDEARRATGASCYTLAVLACRKLLMHIAVSKGAKPGESFVNYVEYLSKNNYVPPDARDWVDHIRKKGNEANHEISVMKKEDAEELLSFIEMLLKVIFEFPAQVKKKYPQPTKSSNK